MARASETRKAERLNRAHDLLLHVDQLSEAVEQLARDCSISPRQAYRYLEQAQQLKKPIPPSEAKPAFTVKLPPSLVHRVRTFAAAKGLSISEVVSRALLALLPRGRGRG
jgi:predicted DNA-binding transcriptional regulator YafY